MLIGVNSWFTTQISKITQYLLKIILIRLCPFPVLCWVIMWLAGWWTILTERLWAFLSVNIEVCNARLCSFALQCSVYSLAHTYRCWKIYDSSHRAPERLTAVPCEAKACEVFCTGLMSFYRRELCSDNLLTNKKSKWELAVISLIIKTSGWAVSMTGFFNTF